MGTIIPAIEHQLALGNDEYLCAVDVEKAYDNINHNSLCQVLEYIGLFNNKFI